VNRDQLIQAATKNIAAGDLIGANYDYRSMCYLSAIAKLLLAQSRIAAGPQPDAAASTRLHCTRCGRDLHWCVCGPPPVEDDVSPLAGV
jgi:hypothetical protein